MPTKIDELIVLKNDSIYTALQAIDRAALGVCFIVDKDSKLYGVVTDGDVRRALLSGKNIQCSVSEIANTNCIKLPYDCDAEEIQKCLTKKIKIIPLLDSSNVIRDYATDRHLHDIPVLEPNLIGRELEYITECVKSGWISSKGKYVIKFEEMFNEYLDGYYSLAVCNGTVALQLALKALGIGEGDEVIVPDFTFAASINAVINVGAVPVLVDIEHDRWTMDPIKVQAAITSKTAAIMPVHIYGNPCKMDELRGICSKHSLKVIEDCAESLGAEYDGKKTGVLGDAAAFSFFGNKMITTGEGGMVVFKNREDYEFAKILRDHGMSPEKRYWHNYVGFNYRMTNLQAAIGVAQMENIDRFLEAKIRIRKIYDSFIESSNIFINQQISERDRSCSWLYTVKINGSENLFRDELIDKLLLNGIEARPAFYPLHEMPPYKKYNVDANVYPVTTTLSYSSLSLPSSTILREAELTRVVNVLRSVSEIKNLYSS